MSRTPPWYVVLGVIGALAAWEAYRTLRYRRGMKTDPDGTWFEECNFEPGKAYAIEFVLSAPSHEAGEALARSLRSEGFDVVVDAVDDAPECECVATQSFVPDRETFVRLRERLGALVEKYGGTYDGWDTAEEPEGKQ